MNIKTKTQFKKRQTIAQNFIKRYFRENLRAEGAILVGSTNIGVTDKYADIDILIIASPEAVVQRKAAGKGYNETYMEECVEICVDWHSLAELANEIAGWKNDATLWSLSKAKILLDKKREIKRLLDRVRPYPEEIRQEKLFLHFYWLSYYLGIIETSIRRCEFETATFHVYSSVNELAEILFLIDNQFIPIEKWRFHELKKLKLGKKFLPKIRELLCIAQLSSPELEAKLQILKKVHQKLKRHLLAAGIEKEKIGPAWWKFEPNWNVE